MDKPRRPRDRNDFDIAIICALTIESDAVEALFDEIWEGDCAYGKAPTDPNFYTTGRIGVHNVVLAFMPSMGKGTSASVAANFRSSFPRITLGLVVGICGGVPIGTDKKEILLGDIIISTGLVQYDFGRQYPENFVIKDTLEDSLGRPNSEIRSFLKKMAGFRSRQLLANRTSTFLDELCNKEGLQESKYPGADEDKLYEPTYRHKHQGLTSCTICAECKGSQDKVCEDALRLFCSELGCSDDRQVPRNRLRNAEPTATSGTSKCEAVEAQMPLIHFGRIASGDMVMKSGSHRDEVASVEEVVAFEMEGAGVWDNFPTIVIKGVCDYADSHKNKRWQGYAAAAAAACTKALLKEWTITDKREHSVDHSIPRYHWTVPFERNAHFVGCDSQIKELEAKLFAEDRCQKVAIYGLGGVGKTQVALELAYRTREAHPDYSIFWIPANSVEKFEQACLEIGQLLQIPGISEENTDVKQLVKQKLSQETTGCWLLILDNADDADVWFKETSNGPQPTRLIDYLPRSNKGSLVFTTRDRKSALRMAPACDIIEIHQMDETVATDLLKELLLYPNIADDRKIRVELLDRLAYLPLAIVQAAAYINANDLSVLEYLSLFEDTEESIVEVLSEDFEDGGRYKESKNPVATTWLISFEQIRNRDSLAAEYLSYMSCLDANKIPKSLLPPAQPNKRVVEAVGTLVAYSFITKRDVDVSPYQSSTVDQFFDLHRLVHLATRNWLRIGGSLGRWTDIAVTRLAEVFPSDDHRNKVIWAAYLPHAHYVLKSGTMVQDTKERMTLLQKVGLCLLAEGRYSEAEASFLQVLEIRKKVLGQEHPDTLISMANLASTYGNQGRWKEAEELDVQIIETSSRVLGEEHPSTLTSMANLALTFWNQGRWKEAEELNVPVIERRKR
ncbi:putative kinesin light chain, partial [Lepidopterella palustris CBS 459.81]